MAVKNKIMVLILCIFLSGCARKTPAAPNSVVVRADIICTQSERTYQLTYQHPQKLEALLNFLRTLRYQGSPETSPETLSGDRFEIQFTMSDGSVRTHRIQDYAYLRRNGKEWEKIDPLQGRSLVLLLKLMPQDGKNSSLCNSDNCFWA